MTMYFVQGREVKMATEGILPRNYLYTCRLTWRQGITYKFKRDKDSLIIGLHSYTKRNCSTWIVKVFLVPLSY